MLKYHIQTIEVPSGGSSNITFSNIPQTYDDLLLVTSVRSNRANQFGDGLQIVFNSSVASSSSRFLNGYNNSVSSGTRTILEGAGMAASLVTANTFSNSQTYIGNYRSAQAKSLSSDGVVETNGNEGAQFIQAGLWNNTSPVISIALISETGNSFVQHSSATLYGIKRGSDGRTEVASGGTITTSGGFTIHTFTGSGTFVANRNLDVDYLVVAGGGGGVGEQTAGSLGQAGGGAGGYRTSAGTSGGGSSAENSLTLTASTSYTVIVGAGGVAGDADSSYIATSGSNSLFSTITSTGGGCAVYAAAGASGGSGGGGGRASGAGGSGTTNQGFAGGAGIFGTGGGGGGAGGVGAVGVSTGAAGGVGVASSITGTSITRALGGGGGRITVCTSGTDASANTGSGGGGGGSVGCLALAGNGGSGIVIIRYLTPA